MIQVKGRLALAQAQLQREITNRDSVIAQFVEAVGEKPGELAVIEDQSAALPKTLDKATASTAINHPDLNLLYNTVKRAGHAITEAKAAYQPEVSLELTASENENLSKINMAEFSDGIYFVRVYFNDSFKVFVEVSRLDQLNQ